MVRFYLSANLFQTIYITPMDVLNLQIPPFNLSFNENPYLFIELYIIPIAFLFSTSLITAPFGKFSREGWGLLLPGKLTFFAYEAISGIAMTWFLYSDLSKSYQKQLDSNPNQTPVLPFKVMFLGACYVGHYFYRSVIYTFGVAHSMKPQSILVALCGGAFNLLNAYNNAHGLLSIPDMTSSISWAGAMLFFYGIEINIRSDAHLAKLRKLRESKGDESNQEYFIPYAGYFEYVSCANYFGECMEWLGWALMTNNLAGWAFFLCTLGNLVPRAVATHGFYKRTFKSYPTSRKALIPFVF